MDDEVEVACPYCGEAGAVAARAEDGDEEFVQDCPVCCRPWRVRIRFRPDGSADVSVDAEGE
jgi:endogenous inhibitor of DNA gyrase (YacG/DUF329 family)